MTMDEKLDLLLMNMQGMQADIAELKTDVASMKVDISNLKADISNLKADMREVKLRLTKVETTLENVTNHNIKIIAEGHIDLSKKLDEALKATRENEMLYIRMNVVEEDLRQLKQHVYQTA